MRLLVFEFITGGGFNNQPLPASLIMQIIPVIDIKAGEVVLASQGQRDSYLPLSTPLCRSSQIDAVINAYLSIEEFSHVYIADLDALMKTGNNYSLINSLFRRR
jgi:phosphoribosylformimino-5-aminoimidazole carboxamide ribotide isomerase